MPSKKYDDAKATKKSSRPVRSESPNIEVSRRTSNKIERNMERTIKKNFGIAAIICFILFLIVGGLTGFFVLRNDKFEMNAYSNGEVDIYIGEEEEFQEYKELGVVCKFLGKDISDDVKITYKYREDISFDPVEVDGVDVNTSGIYYAIYTIDHFKYKDITLIMNIIVLREEDWWVKIIKIQY